MPSPFTDAKKHQSKERGFPGGASGKEPAGQCSRHFTELSEKGELAEADIREPFVVTLSHKSF